MEQLAWLVLKRPYRCIKCDRIQLGFIFLDFHSPGRQKPRHKSRKKQAEEIKCPECGGTVRRSRRRGIERLLFFSKAYRCSECEIRFRTFKLV
jgi:DNA-directed RNA polymerase subunit RPC12/RpoP